MGWKKIGSARSVGVMKRFLTIIFSLFICLDAAAQITTASLRGAVTDGKGEPLVGATIVLRQSEAGLSYSAISGNEGRYAIHGIRPAEGYTLEVDFLGYAPLRQELTLRVGESLHKNITLSEDAQSLDAIVVEAEPALRQGVTRHFGEEEIASMPTVSRSLYDLIRLSPHAMANKGGGMTYAGVANRFNAFMVDGMANNDMYGLSSSGTNGGLSNANPVSLDAIAQIEVAVAPFDVRISGFNGGSVNAITKSGTNTLSGSAYTYYNNQDFYGTPKGKLPVENQTTQTYGFTIGGPIVKDKLFFFLSGEYALNTSPSAYYFGYEGSHLISEELDRISARYKALTGFDGGGYLRRDVEERSANVMAKLDWNINARNTLSLSYSFLDARSEGYGNSVESFTFAGSGYANYSSAHYLAAVWESQLSHAVHNSLRIGYSRVGDGRDADKGGGLPSVIVRNTGTTDNVTINIGTNRYAGINDLKQNVVVVTDDLILDAGAHSLTIGMHHEIYDIHNRYIANSYGTYTYNSIEDFEQDRAAIYEYNYTDPEVAGSTTWGPHFKAAELNFYAQDSWDLGHNINLKYGVRATLPLIFNAPTPNAEFNSSAIAKQHGIRIGDVPRSQLLLSPRVALSWMRHYNQGTLQLSAGAGVFTGQVPFVWIVNNYSNTGVEQKGVKLVASAGESAAPFTMSPSLPAESNTSQMLNAMDGDFRYPTVFKTNLTAEFTSRNGWKARFDALYTKTIHSARFRNVAVEPTGEWLQLTESDSPHKSLPMFKRATSDYTAIYYMDNTSKGYSYSLAAELSKSFSFGLSLSASYIFGHSYSVCDVPSTSSSTNWTRGYAIDLNDETLAISAYDIPHKFTFAASYHKRYAPLFDVTVGLVYQMVSGQAYSLCFGEGTDINGDGVFGSTLMYIPTSEEMQSLQFADAESGKRWETFIAADDYLSSHRGGFAERNAMRTPTEHHLDMHLSHGFYFGKASRRKVEISIDVINLANLICNDWGKVYNVAGWRQQPVKIERQENNQPVYRFTSSTLTTDDILSRWHMQIGARIVF